MESIKNETSVRRTSGHGRPARSLDRSTAGDDALTADHVTIVRSQPPPARPPIRRETESSEPCVKNEMALAGGRGTVGLQPLRALRVIGLFRTSSPMYCRKRHFTPRSASTSQLPEVGCPELLATPSDIGCGKDTTAIYVDYIMI